MRSELRAVAPRNAKRVELEELRTSGVNNHGVSLLLGDIIKFPKDFDDVMLYQTEMKNGSKINQIEVEYNGEWRFMPIGTFRRKPFDFQENLKGYDVNLKIIGKDGDSDYERLPELFGKTIKVTEIITRPFPVFENGTVKRDDKGEIVTRDGKVAIFSFI